ncbi:MAG: tripartite tricarboxylate transporter substrate-binding protein [Paracoccus sp. (in: a-proteobacteria)]|uniref:tripartite tricarboxylate transporter substrate-binding protein n=1 Tax=Paracoccus sp. TaxID=267 RepID=UPI0040591E44
MRLLGVLDSTDDPRFPDAPTLKEAGLDVKFPSIVRVLAPAGTDPAIVGKLETAFTEAASSDEFEKFMSDLGQPVHIMSAAELATTIEENLVAYREIAKDLNNSVGRAGGAGSRTRASRH